MPKFLLQAGFVASFRYAAEGSRKRSEWWMPLLGALAGFVLLKLLGLEPMFFAWFPSNPLAQNAFTIAVCVAFGVVFVFVSRLAYSPLHFLAKRHGGYGSLWRDGLSMPLLPVILMAIATFLFVVLFAAGGILYIMQNTSRSQLSTQVTAPSPSPNVAVSLQLSDEDKEYRRELKKFVLSDCESISAKFGALLHEMAVANAGKTQADRALSYTVNEVTLPHFYIYWSDLYNYANQDTSKIDIESLAKLTDRFLQFYSSYQRMFAVLITSWDSSARNPMFYQEWLEADKNSLYALRNLKASSSKYLMTQDSVMYAARPQ